MVQKDLNLFDVYKNSPSKPGKNGYKSIVTLVIVFSMIIGLTYGTLLFLKMNMNNEIKSINNDLAKPEVAAVQQRLEAELKKNELMNKYYRNIKTAKKNFDNSKLIDSQLLNKIYASIPANVSVLNMTASNKNISIHCNSSSFTSAADTVKALQKNDEFKNIAYSSVDMDAQTSLYVFTITLNFNEVEVTTK